MIIVNNSSMKKIKKYFIKLIKDIRLSFVILMKKSLKMDLTSVDSCLNIPEKDECCICLVCFVIALTNWGFECPQTLHHIEPTASIILLPLESISHIPLPFDIVSNEDHSLICVFGCHTELFN